jgi:hypothetical protein
LVSQPDQIKTTFRTKWGTYAYRKMPFRLINAGATFQRAMDIAFRGLINKSMVVYLDDITVYSRNRNEHVDHLRQIFDRCRRYGISLNPKKTIFVVTEGKLLGFIVSKLGIIIDPERTKAISQIYFPHNKKNMQSFLGKINFVRRFVPSFVEIVKPLQDMIKNNYAFKWEEKERESFKILKKQLFKLPLLMSPDFEKNLFCILLHLMSLMQLF